MKSYRCYDIFLYLVPSLTLAYFQYVILFIFSLASFVTLISKTYIAPSGRFERVTVTQSKHSFEIDGSIWYFILKIFPNGVRAIKFLRKVVTKWPSESHHLLNYSVNPIGQNYWQESVKMISRDVYKHHQISPSAQRIVLNRPDNIKQWKIFRGSSGWQLTQKIIWKSYAARDVTTLKH